MSDDPVLNEGNVKLNNVTITREQLEEEKKKLPNSERIVEVGNNTQEFTKLTRYQE